MMFLPHGAWIHGVHALIRRIVWTYPHNRTRNRSHVR
jgi:hypothetical protein